MPSLLTRPGVPTTPSTPGTPATVPPSGVTATPYYQEIAEKIRRQIAAGLLKPGDELPPRHAIAAEHGTSVEPARRALEILEREGLIVLRQGKRATVAAPTKT